MDLKELFKDFNASKFVFFGCLFPFSILLSLKLNGDVEWSIWTVFAPLWVLNVIVILGAVIGTYQWCMHPEEYRSEHDSFAEFMSMLITVGLHLTVLTFEVLLCINVDGHTIKWLIVFTPLFFASPIAVAACIWGFKHDRSLELEATLSANILLFIFIALQLDHIIQWKWTIVFIPLWILMSFPTIGVLYYFLWTLIFFRSPWSVRRNHLIMAGTWLTVVIPLIIFQVMIAYKLEGKLSLDWGEIFIPLHVSLFGLIIGSFGSKGGNKWWFGMEVDFCHFLLDHCPFLRLYGNISFKIPVNEEEDEEMEESSSPPSSSLHTAYVHLYGYGGSKHSTSVITSLTRGKHEPVMPVVFIDTPD